MATGRQDVGAFSPSSGPQAGAGLAGKLLIAMPGIGDPRFERTVIMLCLHTAQEAMGLIVNKPKDEISLSDVLDHLGIAVEETIGERTVLEGGPVKPDRGFVLHSADFHAPEATQDVAPGIRLTATRDVLEALGRDGQAPDQFVLALGYAGWGPGQLEAELSHNAWLVADADQAIVFGDAHGDKWQAAIRTLGVAPEQLMSGAGRA